MYMYRTYNDLESQEETGVERTYNDLKSRGEMGVERTSRY